MGLDLQSLTSLRKSCGKTQFILLLMCPWLSVVPSTPTFSRFVDTDTRQVESYSVSLGTDSPEWAESSLGTSHWGSCPLHRRVEWTPAGQAVKTAHEGKLWARIIQGTQAINSFPCGSTVRNPPAIPEPPVIRVQSLGWENPPEEGMAIHSSTWNSPGKNMGCSP